MSKLAYLLSIVALVIFSFGCKTEAEQRTAERVEKLDNLLEKSRPQLDQFFGGMQNLILAVKPHNVLTDSTKLSPADTVALKILASSYDSVHVISGDIYKLNPPLKFGKNAQFMRLSPDAQTDSKENLITYTWFFDKQIAWNILDRLKNDTWHYTISEPAEYESEETRTETANETEALLTQFAECEYILSIEDVFMKDPVYIDNQNFKSGYLLSKVHVFSVRTQKIVASFYTYNENGFVNFVVTTDAAAIRNDLISDLKNETFMRLKKRFER